MPLFRNSMRRWPWSIQRVEMERWVGVRAEGSEERCAVDSDLDTLGICVTKTMRVNVKRWSVTRQSQGAFPTHTKVHGWCRNPLVKQVKRERFWSNLEWVAWSPLLRQPLKGIHRVQLESYQSERPTHMIKKDIGARKWEQETEQRTIGDILVATIKNNHKNGNLQNLSDLTQCKFISQSKFDIVDVYDWCVHLVTGPQCFCLDPFGTWLDWGAERFYGPGVKVSASLLNVFSGPELVPRPLQSAWGAGICVLLCAQKVEVGLLSWAARQSLLQIK